MKERSVILCNTARGCCPILTLKEDTSVEIKDDYGNTVKMELSQAQMISDKLKEIVPENQSPGSE